MSLYQNQKAVKPKIEDVVSECISGDNLGNLTNFLVFLKDSKLTPRWQSSNSWKVTFRNKSVCYINLNRHEAYGIDEKDSWMIRHSHFTREQWFQNYDEYITDDELKQFILDNIQAPPCVGKDCWGRQSRTILGRHFDEVCTCWPLVVTNPNERELENEKKLLLVVKKYITDLSAAKKE